MIARDQSRKSRSLVLDNIMITELIIKYDISSLLISSLVSLFVGYYGIRYFYDAADSNPESSAPEKLLNVDAGSGDGMSTLSLSFLLIVFCMFLTGCGGNSGLCACINATAKSFPDKTVS